MTLASAPGQWPTNKRDVEKLLDEHFNISGSTKELKINEDLTVEVHGGGVALNDAARRRLTRLPVRFRYVSGDFLAGFSNLNTLDGFPSTVGQHCSITDSEVASLEHAPTKVGSFDASHTKITSLTGGPKYVEKVDEQKASYDVSYTPITTLHDIPKVIPGKLNLMGCSGLTSLRGLPLKIGTLVFDWNQDLKLLGIFLSHIDKIEVRSARKQIQDLVVKYQNGGRQAAVAATTDLIKAGFHGNAHL